MNKYHGSMIYKLVNDVDEKIYIGSTFNGLRKRKCQHKSNAKTKNTPVYLHLNNVGWENVKIILIEEFRCANKIELLRRERYWIDLLNPELNRQLPTRSRSEWHKGEKRCQYLLDNHEKRQNNSRVWHQNNKERVSKYRSEKVWCECGGKFTHGNISIHYKTVKHQNYLSWGGLENLCS